MAAAGPERQLGWRSGVGAQPQPHWAEEVARRHLEGLGWRTLAQNYRLRGGELDLVMLDGAVIVVVEVRQRRSTRFGTPAETIDRRKLARLRRTAHHYLTYELRELDARVRLDAVLLLGGAESFQLTHLRGIG